MTSHVEWRTGRAGDSLVVVDDDDRITAACAADAAVISRFLTDMVAVGDDTGPPLAGPATGSWGALVLARADTGEVLDMDPELFWDRVHALFRSRGVDYDTASPG
jgi:hypothetical protein